MDSCDVLAHSKEIGLDGGEESADMFESSMPDPIYSQEWKAHGFLGPFNKTVLLPHLTSHITDTFPTKPVMTFLFCHHHDLESDFVDTGICCLEFFFFFFFMHELLP